MLLDLGITSGMQLKQILRLSELAQKLGLKYVWLGEDISGHHDVFTVASYILLKHSNLNVGIGITSPLIRNITTLARASVSLAQIGGDKRFRLGLGIGGLQDLKNLGITVKNPVSLMHNATTLLRRIWKGETVSFQAGAGFTLQRYHPSYRLSYQIPIFFGVRGPKLLMLAGEIADGVILSGPKTYLMKAASLVRTSLQKRPEASRDFPFVVWVPTILTEKPGDLKLVKRIVAFVLADTPKKVLEMAELNLNEIEKIKLAFRNEGISKASRMVTEGLIEEIAIHGNPTQICEAFKQLEKLGVQEVVFGPPYGSNPEAALTKLAQTWWRSS